MRNAEHAMIVLQGGGSQKHWVLDREEILIGRQDDCDIVLPDRKVSRHHARIVREPRGYVIYDLQSKNGTFVNGEPVGPGQVLADGDVIQIALSFQLTFIDAGATVPLFLDSGQMPMLRLDTAKRDVYIGSRVLAPPLSPAQFRLLELLFHNSGKVVSRDDIVDAVWPETAGEGVSEQAIDALVRRLRERLAEIDPDWQYVVTIRGHGFRLDIPPGRGSAR